MENVKITRALTKFVQHVSQCHSEHGRPLTVNDLRLGIRSVRMSEISDYSDHDLDVIEVHAAQIDSNAPLESVFNTPLAVDPAACVAVVSSISSPSPFAWM